MSDNPRQAMLGAVKAQQRMIETLAYKVAVQDLLLDYVADLAGISSQVTAIRKRADQNNPGSPYPDPPSEGPSESTEEAATPEARDNALNPGMTPGSVNEVPAEGNDVALRPGESVPTAPFNDLVNVQAPVSGTEQQIPLNQTRIETDVRVGDPMAPDVAYPWTLASNRTTAAIHLARLQIGAGVAETGDDLALGAQIEASRMSDAEIETTIRTLDQVRKAAARAPRPTGLVPRSASVQRTTPSLVGESNLQASASLGMVDDTADSDLFD